MEYMNQIWEQIFMHGHACVECPNYKRVGCADTCVIEHPLDCPEVRKYCREEYGASQTN